MITNERYVRERESRFRNQIHIEIGYIGMQ